MDFCGKLFEHLVEAVLLGGGYGEKFQADAVQARPPDRRVADHDRRMMPWGLKM